MCPYLLPEITPALRDAYPDLAIQWTEDKTSALVGRITEGTLDGGIVAVDPRVSGLESVEIGHDPFVLAAHREKQERFREAADLYHKLENVILPKYYDPDKSGWSRMMKNAISKNAYHFNSHRMMRRYVTEAYIR